MIRISPCSEIKSGHKGLKKRAGGGGGGGGEREEKIVKFNITEQKKNVCVCKRVCVCVGGGGVKELHRRARTKQRLV